jgi:hypothetical protein
MAMYEPIEPPLPLGLPTEPQAEAVPTDSDVGSAASISHFDYTAVDAGIATEMRAAAARVHQLHRAAVLEVGRELITIKERIEHGQFLNWVTRECHMSIRGAQRAMQAAEMLAKNDNLSYLPIEGLLALGSRAAPEAAVAGILDGIASGARPPVSEIKRLLSNAAECRGESSPPEVDVEKPLTPGQLKYRASREAEFRRRDEVARLQDEEMERAADEAVELLLDCLGNRLQEFIDIWTRTEPFYIGRLLMKKREAMR